MRRPSQLKLPDEDMRLFLHQILEELHAECLKENSDFFTHDYEVTLTYKEENQGYTYAISPSNPCCRQSAVEQQPNRCCHGPRNLIPVFLKFMDATQDPEEDIWTRVNISQLTTLHHDAAPGVVRAAQIGNNWQGFSPPQFKFNAPNDFIEAQQWRMYCRIFPDKILGYDDWFPWPGEYTSLVEHLLVERCLPMVDDNSPEWSKFVATQQPLVMKRISEQKRSLWEWLNSHVENRIVTNQGYHYRDNNAQRGTARRRHRVEW